MTSKAKATHGYPSQRAAIAALLSAGKKPDEVARFLNIDKQRVHAVKSDIAIKDRRRSRLHIRQAIFDAVEAPAAERNMTSTALIEKILSIVVDENLFDAVLGVPKSRQAKRVAVPPVHREARA